MGQPLVHEKMRDLFELAAIGNVEDVIAAVMQIVAGAPNGAERGIAGYDTGEGDGFFRFEAGRCVAQLILGGDVRAMIGSARTLSKGRDCMAGHMLTVLIMTK